MRHEQASPAVDAGRVLSALHEAGVAGAELRSLALDRAWPWRDDGVCALFVDRREPPGRREWTVLEAPGGSLPRGLRRLDALGAFVLPPGGDPELPVGELLDGELAGRRLRRWLGGTDPAARLETRARGYKPLRRMMVEYRRPPAAGRPAVRLFGKALRSRDLARIAATWAACAASPAAAGLALPRAVVRRRSMLLFEPRPGTALDRLIPGPAAARGVAVAGEALAALHGGDVALPGRHPRRREVETLERWLRCAARACPEMAGGLGAARRRLARLGGSLPLGPAVPSHRDFHPGQLLLAPRGGTILDLDTAAMAEPELDPGNFLAHLDLFELQRRPVPAADLAGVFRTAYQRRAGRQPDPRRLLWYRAGAVLRLACVYRFRPGGAILGNLLTRRCLDLLDSGTDSVEVI